MVVDREIEPPEDGTFGESVATLDNSFHLAPVAFADQPSVGMKWVGGGASPGREIFGPGDMRPAWLVKWMLVLIRLRT
jgi:hypothetical protein